MKDHKKYTVSILGKSYIIRSDEPESHVNQAVQFINDCAETIKLHDSMPDNATFLSIIALQLASDLVHKNNELKRIDDACRHMIQQVHEQCL